MYYLEFYKKELSLIPSVFNHLFRSVWTHVDVFCILCCYPILHYSVLQVVPNLSIVELFQGNSCIPLICSRTHFLYCTRCFKFIFFPLVSALESAIFFSRNLVPFIGEWYLKTKIGCWVCLLLLECHCFKALQDICVFLKIKWKFLKAYRKAQIFTITQLEQLLISGQFGFMYMASPHSSSQHPDYFYFYDDVNEAMALFLFIYIF